MFSFKCLVPKLGGEDTRGNIDNSTFTVISSVNKKNFARTTYKNKCEAFSGQVNKIVGILEVLYF